MIQHLHVDSSPVIKSQTLLDLGKVNIITGRNSSGKSTILRKIVEYTDIGVTYQQSPKTESVVRGQIANYAQPSRHEIDDWVAKIMHRLDGEILFCSSESKALALVDECKQTSLVRTYGLDIDAKRIAHALISHVIEGGKPLLLSPKRRLPPETEAHPMENLDSEAANALSRLFYLKNQMPDTAERLVFDRIHSSFCDITGNEFDIQMLRDRHPPGIQLQFRKIGGPWIPAQNEGLGLPELLSILLYSLDGDNQLLLVEEPENHLHPDLQRKLLSFLNSVEDRQFILSTHSPVFLNPDLVDRIYFCKYDNGEITIDDNTSRADALSNIGVLAIDNLTSDAVLITEGKTDLLVIDYIVRNWLGASRSASVSHVFLAGSMMMYFDPTPFVQIRNTFALLDLDTSNTAAQNAFIANCRKIGLIPIQLSRYCLENYYTLAAVRAAFGSIVPSQLEKINPDVPPWRQLADKLHNEDWWKGELKSTRRIFRILASMSLPDIAGSDLLQFCQSIKSVL
ncbi:MAG: AAA family ATPase [bacterium]